MSFQEKSLSIIKKVVQPFWRFFLWLKVNNGILGVIVAGFSLYIGYLSLDISNKSLAISKATSIRDSLTSLQDEKNNDRDSVQQGEMVKLLEKYNKIADKLLETQIQADRPIINLGIIRYDDAIKNVFLENGKSYFMPIIHYYIENKGKRESHNFSIQFKYFFKETNSFYINNIRSSANIIGFDTNVKPLDCPVIPVDSKNDFYFKVSLSWEDRFVDVKKYSREEYICIKKLSNGLSNIDNAQANDIKIIKEIESKGTRIKIPQGKIDNYLSINYPQHTYQ